MGNNKIDRCDLHTLEETHSGNVQWNVDDVVVLAFSFSRSDLIQRYK
jgi:hypothetical protein